MQRNLADFYFKEAKRLGFLARSAFKLVQIQSAHKVITPGCNVLDLGCSPGAWLQVACKELGPAKRNGGMVLGVDLKATPVPQQHCDGRVQTMQGDVTELHVKDLLALCPRGFNTVLSDMAPSTSGAKSLDVARSLDLAESALGLALGDGSDADGTLPHQGVLLPGGNFVVKVLEGKGVRDLASEYQSSFKKIVWMRPKATRDESKEVYMIGLHRTLQ